MQQDRGSDVATSALAREAAVDILVHGARPRAVLAERLGISAATVTRLVRPLMAAEVLVETDLLRHPGPGRSARSLDVVPGRYRFIGVKVTGDAVFAVLTDLRAHVLTTHSAPLRSHGVTEVVEAVRHAVAEVGAEAEPVDAVGVTVGGLVDDGEVVRDSPFLDWHEVPFRSLLAEALSTTVHLENDVVGLTKAQHWFGHGRGLANFALLTVGAGIGYGLVVNHRMVRTPINPITHFPIRPDGPQCSAGHRGCMASYLTSPSIAATVSEGLGRPVTFEEALALAEDADPVALRAVRDAAHALGRASAAVSATTGVERIILSGEGVHLADIAPADLERGFREYDIEASAHSELAVRPMTFLEWARGAAAVAIQAEFPRPPQR
ncbi:ROK family protein [Brachybacterium sp. YJGR34]|uniref:ROK family protein n=1 Tax=Brachybacterium sp. YJGR34 TaxID=2059911 RepID=UPI000E0B5693|nr:ROK family protein [Brachybacterium sp. YJGR34]